VWVVIVVIDLPVLSVRFYLPNFAIEIKTNPGAGIPRWSCPSRHVTHPAVKLVELLVFLPSNCAQSQKARKV